MNIRKFATLRNLKRLTLSGHIDVHQADFDFLQAALPNTKIECEIVEVRIAKWKAMKEQEKSAKKVDNPTADEKTVDEK